MHTTFSPDEAYQIRLGSLADTFAAWMPPQAYTRTVLLCDTHTRQHCAPLFFEKTGLSPTLPIIEIPAGEAHKNLATCQHIWDQMLALGLDRRAVVVNLGGGVVGDMGGFCAATYKRGVDFVQVPTTLLAATDAAIGGKLGIDYQGIKNIIGVFRHPAQVLVDPDFLRTLPERELRSGFAEVIKHAAIGDARLWHQISELRSLDGVDWHSVLADSIRVKVEVVRQDPLERGLRAVLNYGHTIGHALESFFLDTDDPLTHGEAVAVGMILETSVAAERDAAFAPRLAALRQLVPRFFSSKKMNVAPAATLWQLMQQDKKNVGGAVRMVLPTERDFEMQTFDLTLPEMEKVFLEVEG
jgi:3-dehydroquinate synthase